MNKLRFYTNRVISVIIITALFYYEPETLLMCLGALISILQIIADDIFKAEMERGN